MSGNKPERVGNFSPKEKADAWDKAGRGRPRVDQATLSLTSCQLNKGY